MIDVFTQHDLNKRHEAEGEDYIAYDWDEGEIYRGEEIYTLADGTIVLADIDEMKAYLKYRIRKLGLKNWVQNELGEGHVDDFIISLTIDHLSLEELFESYYDADRSNAGEAV
ncbi:hypothetical protein [Lacticaseibacillus porcinae]|uniref:hypothetical protein n=1 Tax=Lacticaseibacillus porcinae TaxID=1123687 RepID=UPI000F780F93|nr:hypothetical protein [Lacticaseibacillus porcinae]